MPQNYYSYNLRDAANGNKLVGGCLHANSLDDAARKAIRQCKLTIRKRGNRFYTDIDFIRDGRKVYLAVGVHPEYYLDAAPVEEVPSPSIVPEESDLQ